MDARLALANYYWSTSQRAKAEATLKDTIALEPKNEKANRAMALFYLGAGRKSEAEAPLKTYAEVAPGPAGRLALADYYAAMQQYASAKTVLEGLAQDPAGMMPAKLRLATLGVIAGDRAEAERLVDEVLKKDPKQLDALVAKVRLQLMDRKLDAALTTAKAAVAAQPTSPQAQYMLGNVLLARDQPEDAATAFKEALRLNPSLALAHMELAKLALTSGKNDEAVQYAQSAIQSMPNSAEANLLLARAQLANHNPSGAEKSLKALERAFPSNPAVQTELGRFYLAQGNHAAARSALEKALQADRGNLAATRALVGIDLQEHKPDAARTRIDAAQAAAPDSVELEDPLGTGVRRRQ